MPLGAVCALYRPACLHRLAEEVPAWQTSEPFLGAASFLGSVGGTAVRKPSENSSRQTGAPASPNLSPRRGIVGDLTARRPHDQVRGGDPHPGEDPASGMTPAESLTVLIAASGLALGIRSYFRDKKRDDVEAKLDAKRHAFEKRINEEAVATQLKLLRIEEERHRWEREERGTKEAQRQETEQQERTASFRIRFGYRDSARTWARIIATNEGQADAFSVRLVVLAETRDGDLVDVEPVGGTDYGVGARLHQGESVSIGVAFSLGFPQPDDLRYRLTWVDANGEQVQEGRVPVDQ